MNTIFALATPEGKSGVAIIRVSGENAFQLFEKFSCPDGSCCSGCKAKLYV